MMTICFIAMSSSLLYADHVVRGFVTSAIDKKGVPGANVIIKNSRPQKGVQTDASGHYSITVPDGQVILVYSFMGFGTEERDVNRIDEMNVELGGGAMNLDAVIVTGYGTIKKSTYTGSAAIIDGEVIEKAGVTNVTKAFEGVVPGVTVSGTSGQPGSGVSLNVRGIGSVYGNATPLYIVDGALFSADIVSSINPDDIENVTTLKDAASTSLYGAKGANGVILITTKKSKSKNATINFKANFGIVTRGTPEYDVLDQKGYYEAVWRYLYNTNRDNGRTKAEAGAMASGIGTYSNQGVVGWLYGYNAYNVANSELLDPVTGKLNPDAKLLWDDDWTKELIGTGYKQEYQFSASKGDANNNFFASVGYSKESGMVPNTGFSRLTGRVTTSNRLTKWLHLDMGLNASHQNMDNVAEDGTGAIVNPFNFTRHIPKIYPIWQHDPVTGKILYDNNGEKLFDFGSAADGQQPGTYGRRYNANTNLVASLPLDYSGQQLEILNGHLGLEADIWGGISAGVDGNFELANAYGIEYNNSKYGAYANENGLLSRNQIKRITYTIKEYISFLRTFKDVHNVSARIGHESYAYNNQSLSASVKNFSRISWELANGTEIVGLPSSSTNNDRSEGYFALANYDYDGKYFAAATYRKEATSRLYSKNRWGDFWSVSGAWNIAREGFMENASKWVDMLKLRASYGTQGNISALGLYEWIGLYAMNIKNGSYPGALLSTNSNEYIKWESQGLFNIGVDFMFLKRLSGSLEYYRRNNVDMIFWVSLPPSSSSTGGSYKNIGKMHSDGIEFQLDYTIINNKNVRWSVGLNLTHESNMIDKIPEENDSLGINNGNFHIQRGHSMSEYYMYKFAGLDANGNSQYYNAKGEKVTYTELTTSDYQWLGKFRDPVVYGGLNTTVAAYGFDLSVVMSFSIGGYTYDAGYASLMETSQVSGNWHEDMLKAYNEDNTDSELPKFSQSTASANNYSVSDMFLISRSYFNLRTVTLGYTLPSDISRKAYIKSLRVYCTLDNFYMKSARKGYNPLWAGSGNYFPTKTVLLGLNVTF